MFALNITQIHSYIVSSIDCNYTFQIDLAPIGILVRAKSIGKLKLQSKFDLDQ